ncbi:MAG: hypothetical protein A3G64_00930 [Candidatus Liptonbacteria bacterium RIFCSPLOWO2_12_FULL_60_15]|uniref:Nucleotidyltransferase family protein n=2 Tax=Candidatus Liptoniibacteriota TaxID=1817909 RepID=A0A1G2CKV4_9BACT|nr:MAG: hypothetical protein A3G64_00930 [Candidatus Liptonbacteria bacterium RIFCSPLOWO2_12_FULL_60_15]
MKSAMGSDVTEKLEKILTTNGNIRKILERAPELRMPNCYLAAGCISQTVWNTLHGFSSDFGIKDYDLVYYDPSDISYEGEDSYIREGKRLFADVPAVIEIKNQARVHLWFEQKFGFKIPPYQSVEDAISSWSTTATCVGVRRINNKFEVFAPYGLDSVFEMTVKPVQSLFTQKMYENKVNRWMNLWPKLKVMPWAGQ